MRKLRLERVFASLDEDFQTGSYTEELDDINNILLDNSFCLQESVTQWNEQDEGRVTVRMMPREMKMVMISIAAKLFFESSLQLANKIRCHRWGSLVVQCVGRNA